MTDTSLQILCVLKTGKAIGQQPAGKEPEYYPEHVHRLRDQVHENLSLPHSFVCISDVKIDGVDTKLLVHGWPGWWSKIELFRPDIQARQNVYIDLDTTIQGDLSDMVAYQHKFTVLRNLTDPTRGIGSGFMAWRGGDGLCIYEKFKADPSQHMDECRTRRCWGDQGFIQKSGISVDYWQDLFPGAVASSKVSTHAARRRAEVVCYHGKVKPWHHHA